MIILVTYLGTVVFSFALEKYHEMVMMKDISDAGYKLKESDDEGTHSAIKVQDDHILIPFVNMYEAISNYISYQNNLFTFLSEASMLDLVEEMSKKEKEVYNQNPTLLNAYFLQKKMVFNRARSHSLTLDDGSTIYYLFDNEEIIKIVEATGSLENKSEQEQTEILVNEYIKATDELAEKYESMHQDRRLEELQIQREYFKLAKRYLEMYRDGKLDEEKVRKLNK